jgi:hypothetical protein
MQLNINGKVAAIVAASAVACSGLGLAVSQAVSSPAPQAAPAAKAVTSPTTANPTPTAPAPQNKIIINNNPVSPNVGVPANPNYGAGQFPTYEADIANAGIAAPAGWLDTTGEQLCTDWAAGEGTSQTDPQLLAGGIYQQHLAIFDELTNNDLCPGLTPGP